MSRFGRISICKEKSEAEIAQVKAEDDKERVFAEMKKLYDKVNDLRFKYTHLQ